MNNRAAAATIPPNETPRPGEGTASDSKADGLRRNNNTARGCGKGSRSNVVGDNVTTAAAGLPWAVVRWAPDRSRYHVLASCSTRHEAAGVLWRIARRDCEVLLRSTEPLPSKERERF